MQLKWGIATVGNISHDFVTALSTLPKENHIVLAVAARLFDKANDFATRHSIAKAYEGYERMGEDPSIDIVYIGTVNSDHFRLTKLFLDYGKHVLCEKPLCMNLKQTTELLEYAQSKNLLLLEGVWSRFFPSYIYLQKQIQSGNLGQIKKVNAEFGYPLNYKYGKDAKNLGSGTLLDLGIYLLQLALFVFDEEPEKIEAKCEFNEHGIDITSEIMLHFKNGGIAELKCSGLEILSNRATIQGTKGCIELENFWCPTSLTDIDGTIKQWPLLEASQKFNYPNSCGLSYQAEAIRQALMKGKIEVPLMDHSQSMQLSGLEDKIRKILGIQYPADND